MCAAGMPASRADILLFALGNPGRQDDGLGWAYAEASRRRGFPPASIHLRDHLQVEDAELVAGAHRVLFVDACRTPLPGGFSAHPCRPSAGFCFTTHELPPATVLYLGRELYGRLPRATCLLIAGEAWELGHGLSRFAAANLARAQESFRLHPG